MSCWEIAQLERLGRIRLDRPVSDWVPALLAAERVRIATLSPSAAADAALLGPTFPNDPADRFLYTTARELGVPLVTRDERIREFARQAGEVTTIW